MSQSLEHAAEQFYREKELDTLLQNIKYYTTGQEFLLQAEKWRSNTNHPITERPRYTENITNELQSLEVGEEMISSEIANNGENPATYGGILNFLGDEGFFENSIGKNKKKKNSIAGAAKYQYLVEKDFLETAVEYIDGENNLEDASELIPEYKEIRETFLSSSRFDEVNISRYKPHNVGWPSREKQIQEQAFEDLLKYLNNLHVLENNNGGNSFDPDKELILEGSKRETELSLKLLDHI